MMTPDSGNLGEFSTESPSWRIGTRPAGLMSLK